MRAAYMQAYRGQRRARGQCLDCPRVTTRYARCFDCRRKRAAKKWRNTQPQAA